MRIWYPKKKLPPCHENGLLQSASDACAYRSRFRLNPFAKVGSILLPTVLRFGAAAGRRRCCCGSCITCVKGGCADAYPVSWDVTISGVQEGTCTGGVYSCTDFNDSFVCDSKYSQSIYSELNERWWCQTIWTYSFPGTLCRTAGNGEVTVELWGYPVTGIMCFAVSCVASQTDYFSFRPGGIFGGVLPNRLCNIEDWDVAFFYNGYSTCDTTSSPSCQVSANF